MTYLERVSLTWTIVGFGMIAVGGCGSSSSMSARTATATVPHTATATLTAQAAVTSTATPAAAHTATGTAPPTATETPPARPTETPTPAPTSAIFVYWDQNEEEDALIPSGQLVQLVAPWDPNGQMCIFPDSSGRPGQFVTAYNPTLPNQNNLGSLLPYKNPPVGMAVWDRHGGFTGQTIYVPGSYPLPGSDIGGDIPPDNTSKFCTDGKTSDCKSDADCPNGSHCSGVFNNNGTFTGCAFDSKGDLFAGDLGQAQGSLASPDQGRIVEWFPPDYISFCVIIGPTQGGDGPHHINGTGGLRNPGFMAVDLKDNLYVPESGAARVLKFDSASLPRGPQDCGPDGLLVPPAPYQVFVTNFGIPAGIARDPTCSTETANCWAVTNIVSGAFGGNAVGWFDDAGQPSNVKGPIPKGGFSPYGIAVSPSGDVFLVDEGLKCDANGCGPVDGGAGIFKISFSDGHPSATEKIISGLNFPLGVTLCDASKQVCPIPGSQATPVTQPTPTPQSTATTQPTPTTQPTSG